MSSLLGVPVDAAYHVVFALTSALTPVLGGLAAVAAIVMFTIVIRLLLTPLTFRALRGQAAQARLAPRVQRLRERHARRPERLQRELTALYKQEGTSPFAGFGPLLAQWPVFSVLYLLFRSSTVAGGTNLLLSRTLFGVPLGSHLLSGTGAFSAHGAVFAVVLAALAAACWAVTRIARRALPATAAGTPGTAGAGMAGAGTTVATVLKVVPYVTVVIAAFAPLAAAIYLVTTTAWSGAERRAFAVRTGRNAARTDRNQAAVPVRSRPQAQ